MYNSSVDIPIANAIICVYVSAEDFSANCIGHAIMKLSRK